MNLKKMICRVALLIGAATLFAFVGCGLPGAQGLGVTQSLSGRSVLARQHWEETDPQDGLFYTYWEMHYDQGSVSQDLVNNGYNLTWSGYSGNDIVTGKGIKPCYGETISWTTDQNTGADYFGVYGWLRDPLVEYYIGRGGSTYVGEYDTDQGHFTLYVDTLEQANIVNPENDPSLPRKFLQFNCQPSSGTLVNPVNMAQHFAAWERLMASYSVPAGWEWHNIITPDYCVVASEIWGGITSGTIKVSNIQLSGVGTFAHSTFSGSGDGNPATVNTGDNRGYYLDPTAATPNFVNVYTEFPITLQFGDITTDGTRNADGTFKTKIGLIMVQTFTATHVRGDGSSYIMKIPMITFNGQANISGNTITFNGTTTNASSIKKVVITKVDNNTLRFTYDFGGTTYSSGYGVATRDGGLAPSQTIISAALAVIKPHTLPVIPLTARPSSQTVTGTAVFTLTKSDGSNISWFRFDNADNKTLQGITFIVNGKSYTSNGWSLDNTAITPSPSVTVVITTTQTRKVKIDFW